MSLSSLGLIYPAHAVPLALDRSSLRFSSKSTRLHTQIMQGAAHVCFRWHGAIRCLLAEWGSLSLWMVAIALPLGASMIGVRCLAVWHRVGAAAPHCHGLSGFRVRESGLCRTPGPQAKLVFSYDRTEHLSDASLCFFRLPEMQQPFVVLCFRSCKLPQAFRRRRSLLSALAKCRSASKPGFENV